MNHQYKLNPITKITLLVVLIVAGDAIVGHALKYYYFRQQSGSLYRTHYTIEKAGADLLIFGSSRANHHYDALDLENLLHTSVYNAGKDGSHILYQTALLRSVLKRHAPRQIILDLDVKAFRKAPDTYDKLSELLPYYASHPEIRNILDLKSPFEKYKMWSSIYPYNSMVFTIAMGNMEKNKKRKMDISGYVPLYRRWNRPPQECKMPQETDSILVSAFRAFIQEARKAGTEIYVVVSPVCYLYKQSASIEIAKAVCKEQAVTLWDYSRDVYFLKRPDLFADPQHLNNAGARIFSINLSQRIKTSAHGKS